MSEKTNHTPATVAAQGAHVAPEKATPKKAAGQQKDAPKAKKTATSAKRAANTKEAAAKNAAKAGAKATKPTAAKKASAPHAGSKGAKVLEMIARAKGATLAEIMTATDWQAHSVRGFISTAAKKHGVKIESARNEASERVYKMAK